MKNSKLWSIGCLILALVLLAAAGGATVLVDPYFHYHAPDSRLQYPINNQRYQNDGIVRHFSYDALITGTSMTENFNNSQLDALFDVTSVKVAYSGGTFQEIVRNLQRAIDSNPDLELVVFGLDEWFLFAERTLIQANGDYPTYLYDDNLWNDVSYIWNKDIFLQDTIGVLEYTKNGGITTSFDAYSRWDHIYDFNRENVLRNYVRPESSDALIPVTEAAIEKLSQNMTGTLVQLARSYPQIQFYYFFPPYSILNWDSHLREGRFPYMIEGYRLATEMLLEADNIHLFSFFTDYEWTANLDNYRDMVHYSGEISALILERMKNGEFQLTRENYLSHWQEVSRFYSSYDYDALFAAPEEAAS